MSLNIIIHSVTPLTLLCFSCVVRIHTDWHQAIFNSLSDLMGEVVNTWVFCVDQCSVMLQSRGSSRRDVLRIIANTKSGDPTGLIIGHFQCHRLWNYSVEMEFKICYSRLQWWLVRIWFVFLATKRLMVREIWMWQVGQWKCTCNGKCSGDDALTKRTTIPMKKCCCELGRRARSAKGTSELEVVLFNFSLQFTPN